MSLTKVTFSMISGAVANILDYGAIADYDENIVGSGTDNSAAIQAAINAVAAKATDGAVYIPAGRYKILTTLAVPYGVSIFGDGGVASGLFAENCDGISFTSYGYEIGNMFYEDFGLTANSGTNRVAVLAGPNAATMDGLYFSRIRFYGWNQVFVLSANWNCTISNCNAQNVNQAVVLSSNNGTVVGIRIVNNRFVRAAGGLGAASQYAITLAGTTGFSESIHILQNQIFGFSRNINIEQATFVNILGNDLSGSERVISFVTPNGTYNICNNYIEVTGTGTGVYGTSQSVETPATRSVIEQNQFIGTGGASAIGIQLNDATNTFQWNAAIRDNTFTGFTVQDIKLNAPGKLLVDNNRCMSIGLATSIYVDTVAGPTVTLSNNYCVKPIVLGDITDYFLGKVVLSNNTENDLFQPLKQAVAPTTGTWRKTDMVMSSAPTVGQPKGWVCTTQGTPGTWASLGNL